MTMDEDFLECKVSEAIHTGRLPATRKVKRVWCGASDGDMCVVCERAIDAGDIEVLAYFLAPDGMAHFHVHCFNAWDTARSTGV